MSSLGDAAEVVVKHFLFRKKKVFNCCTSLKAKKTWFDHIYVHVGQINDFCIIYLNRLQQTAVPLLMTPAGDALPIFENLKIHLSVIVFQVNATVYNPPTLYFIFNPKMLICKYLICPSFHFTFILKLVLLIINSCWTHFYSSDDKDLSKVESLSPVCHLNSVLSPTVRAEVGDL